MLVPRKTPMTESLFSEVGTYKSEHPADVFMRDF